MRYAIAIILAAVFTGFLAFYVSIWYAMLNDGKVILDFNAYGEGWLEIAFLSIGLFVFMIRFKNVKFFGEKDEIQVEQ